MPNPRLLALLTTLVLVPGCADSPTQPGVGDLPLMGTADRTVKMVPFKGTQTQLPADPTGIVCPAGEAAAKATAGGEATHLGQFTVVIFQCVHPVFGVWSKIDGTFTAANGDELEMEMDPLNPGRIVVFDPATGFESTGGLVIIGGTGRFAGATGYVTFRSFVDFAVLGAFTTLDGEISSPGSIKWTP